MALCAVCYEKPISFSCGICNYQICNMCNIKLLNAFWTKDGIAAGIKCPGCRAPNAYHPNDYKKSGFSDLKNLMGSRDSNELIIPIMHQSFQTGDLYDSKGTVIFKYIPCNNDAQCRGCNESEIKTYVDSNYTSSLVETIRTLQDQLDGQVADSDTE